MKVGRGEREEKRNVGAMGRWPDFAADEQPFNYLADGCERNVLK